MAVRPLRSSESMVGLQQSSLGCDPQSRGRPVSLYGIVKTASTWMLWFQSCVEEWPQALVEHHLYDVIDRLKLSICLVIII